jgi:hypothetical protein
MRKTQKMEVVYNNPTIINISQFQHSRLTLN